MGPHLTIFVDHDLPHGHGVWYDQEEQPYGPNNPTDEPTTTSTTSPTLSPDQTSSRPRESVPVGPHLTIFVDHDLPHGHGVWYDQEEQPNGPNNPTDEPTTTSTTPPTLSPDQTSSRPRESVPVGPHLTIFVDHDLPHGHGVWYDQEEQPYGPNNPTDEPTTTSTTPPTLSPDQTSSRPRESVPVGPHLTIFVDHDLPHGHGVWYDQEEQPNGPNNPTDEPTTTSTTPPTLSPDQTSSRPRESVPVGPHLTIFVDHDLPHGHGVWYDQEEQPYGPNNPTDEPTTTSTTPPTLSPDQTSSRPRESVPVGPHLTIFVDHDLPHGHGVWYDQEEQPYGPNNPTDEPTTTSTTPPTLSPDQTSSRPRESVPVGPHLTIFVDHDLPHGHGVWYDQEEQPYGPNNPTYEPTTTSTTPPCQLVCELRISWSVWMCATL